MRVSHPVAIDNDFAIWRAFKNQYWPALYFVDAQGRVRHEHFGEGSYEQSEMIIQRLLNEAGAGGIGDGLVSVDAAQRTLFMFFSNANSGAWTPITTNP